MLIDRYIRRQTASALILILLSLTLIVWLTSILKELKLLTSQGQTALIFLKITSLAIPSLLITVAPVAFLIASLHTLNRLNGDSEVIVFSAAGASPWRVLKPFAAVAIAVSVLMLIANLYVLPGAARLLGSYTAQVRTDVLSQILQPGEFSSLEKGLTFHIRDKNADGDLLGVVVHDERDKRAVTTVVADRGEILDSGGRPVMELHDGQIIRQSEGKRDAQIVIFESYLFDISDFSPKETVRELKPRERDFADLISIDASNPYYLQNKSKFVSEIHERLSGPLYPLVFGSIAVAYLGRPRTTREGRGGIVFTAFAFGAAIRIAGIAGVSIAGKKAWGLSLVYGLPIAGTVLCLLMLQANITPPSLSFPAIRMPSALQRLFRPAGKASSVAVPR